MKLKNKILQNDVSPVLFLGRRGLLNWIPDEPYIKLAYRTSIGKWPDLEHPKTFNEKINWLKLYDRNPLYTTLVDKVAVKSWVAERIGWEHVVPTLAVWNRPEDIDIRKLPNRFVLKTNHYSGDVCVCSDRSTFDLEEAKRKLGKSMKRNLFWTAREWAYKNVRPCVFAEEYLEPSLGRVNQVDLGFFRFSSGCNASLTCVDSSVRMRMGEMFFNGTWRNIVVAEDDGYATIAIAKSELFKRMKAAVDMLRSLLPFVRVDFYESSDALYFGEITLSINSGFKQWAPVGCGEVYGSWINLGSITGSGGGWLLLNEGYALWLHEDGVSEIDDVDSSSVKDLRDYKLFCSYGEVKGLYIASERQLGSEVKFDFYDADFNHLPIVRNGHPSSGTISSKPICWDEMCSIAMRLSQCLPNVRVDLYESSRGVMFGELTFYHMCGFSSFEPEGWDERLGAWIYLTNTE